MALTVHSVFTSFLITCTIISVCRGQTQNETMSTLLGRIFDGYDKKIPPNQNTGDVDTQVKVHVEMFIKSMFSISEMNMDYSMSLFLRERWIDDRLKFDTSLNLTRLVLDLSFFETLWLPDMFILNEKESDFHEVMVPNKLLHIYPDGTVQLSARVTGTFSCIMQLKRYPFDRQSCNFEVETYGQTTDIVKFFWSENPVVLAKDIQFPQFSLTEITPYDCEKSYFGIAFTCIGVQFELERNFEYHVVQIYIPSMLTVLLSWVNFWLDLDATPARISLGLLTVLTMTTQSASARSNLPRVSYIKAIDVYMAACITFVFLSLIEFAYVNVLVRVETRRNPSDGKANGKSSHGKIHQTTHDNYTLDRHIFLFTCFKVQHLSYIGRARLVDKVSRVIFPVVFLFFNITYWVYYMYLYTSDVVV
ncbi:glycine receptor subunit alpha-2-like [Ruditapes philippinarum]|uniref:glycine receptor subunit alpha-2-like n=1 Tax=Ruditapes philippinarum TaxID=129788 RepID=UPI00295C1959|nr:glycine receptor subunit alpha-2-like [Ruditapes philippinarum]